MAEYELYHYGVKGMKWGVRKSERSSSGGRIRNYIKKKRAETKAVKEGLGEKRYAEYKALYGKKGAKRIHKRVTEKGMSYTKAELREAGRQFSTNMLKAVGQTAVSALIVSAAYKSAETRAKQAANASLLRLEKGGKRAYRFVTDLGDGMQIVENLK